jgi:hypothetical protein
MSPEQLPELLSKARKAPVSATRPCLVMPSPTPRGRIRAKPSVWPRNMQRFVLEPNTAAGQVHSDRTATVYSDRTAYLSSIALTGFLESPARILATRASTKHLTNEKQSDKALTGPGRRVCGRVTHKQRQRQHSFRMRNTAPPHFNSVSGMTPYRRIPHIARSRALGGKSGANEVTLATRCPGTTSTFAGCFPLKAKEGERQDGCYDRRSRTDLRSECDRDVGSTRQVPHTRTLRSVEPNVPHNEKRPGHVPRGHGCVQSVPRWFDSRNPALLVSVSTPPPKPSSRRRAAA